MVEYIPKSVNRYKEVGPTKVVQVVMDNAWNNMTTTNLMIKRGLTYFGPHCCPYPKFHA